MHDFLAVLTWILVDAGLLIIAYVLVRSYRARSGERHPVPEGLANWHDVGLDAAVLRKRAFRWGAVTLVQRAVLVAGVLLFVFQLIAGNPVGWLTVSDWARILGASAAVGMAAAITPLRRRLSDPLYSRPKDVIDERNRGVNGALWLRFGVRAIFYPLAFVYGPFILLYLLVGTIGVVLGGPQYAPALLLMIPILAFMRLLRAIDRWSLRYLAQHGGSMLQDDPRPHFLYLRAFKDDAIDIRAHFPNRRGLIDSLSLSRWLPFEEIIIWRFHHYGPVIAANDPWARLATLGAAKIALPTTPPQAWQGYVEHYARTSLAVIASAAPSELRPGIEWELELLATMEPEHPVVLLIPPRPRRSAWKAVLDFAGRVLRSVLPFLRPEEAEATPAGWELFCDHVREKKYERFDGARQLNPTGATQLITYVPGEGWSAWGAERRTEWTYAICIRQAMEYAEGYRKRTRNLGHPQPLAPAIPRPVPETVRNAIRLMYAGMAIQLAWIVITVARFTPSTNGSYTRGAIVLWMIAAPALWLWTAQRCRRGNRLGRVMATVFFALACVGSVPGLFGTASVLEHADSLAVLAAGLASVVLLWHPASKPHFTRNEDNLGNFVDLREVFTGLKQRPADSGHADRAGSAPDSQEQHGAAPDPGASDDGGWSEKPPDRRDLVIVAVIGGSLTLGIGLLNLAFGLLTIVSSPLPLGVLPVGILGMSLGVIARRYSRSVHSSWESGDRNEAFKASRSARSCAIFAIIIATITVTIAIVTVIVFFSRGGIPPGGP